MRGQLSPIPPTGFNVKQIAASTLIKTGEGDMGLAFISSSGALNLKLWDNTAASGTVLIAQVAVAAKETYAWPAHFNTGLYVEFVSGTGAISVFYV